ncbi:hypothetical protein GCM10027267_29160 [Paramicrobacterium agarici]
MLNADRKPNVGAPRRKLLVLEVRGDGARLPGDKKRLIDHVAAEVTQQASLRSGFDRAGVILIATQFEPLQVSQVAGVENGERRDDVGVEATVVKDVEKNASARRLIGEQLPVAASGTKGLSTMTCRPWLITSRARSLCVCGGVVMTTASTPSLTSSASEPQIETSGYSSRARR